MQKTRNSSYCMLSNSSTVHTTNMADAGYEKQEDHQKQLPASPNLLLKVQTAAKYWEEAPEELHELRQLLLAIGYEVDWSPKRLGINLLTPNKIRGIVLKRVLMKLYPFETFWVTETLEETLQKCLLVCQQLALQTDRSTLWGMCTMNENYVFWKKVLLKVAGIMNTSRDEERCMDEAKSAVISALIASRGTDWDKQIAKNFEEVLGNNRLPVFIKSHKSMTNLVHAKPIYSPNLKLNSKNFRQHTATRSGHDLGTSDCGTKVITTTLLSSELKKESQNMFDVLKIIEKSFRDDCILQIENTFLLGKNVADLAVEFEGYMTANNRGAFRDVESLANHTDKVIRAMAKLTGAYNEFFLEFQKYFCGAGIGDELSLSAAFSKLAEFSDVVG